MNKRSEIVPFQNDCKKYNSGISNQKYMSITHRKKIFQLWLKLQSSMAEKFESIFKITVGTKESHKKKQ